MSGERRSALLVGAAVGLLPLAVGLILFSSTLDDDSYISLWVAERLAETGRLENYNGEALEQSSSLGFVLVLAALVRLVPANPATLAVLLSLAGAVATVAALVVLVRRRGAGLLAGTALPLCFWSLSGNEATLQALAAVLWVGALAAALRRGGRAWLALVAAAVPALLLRPEAGFVLPCAAAAGATLITVSGRRGSAEAPRWGRVVLATALVLGAGLALATWRFSYSGAWLPQPAAAKVSGIEGARVVSGLRYLSAHAFEGLGSPLWILALLAGARCAIRALRGRTVSSLSAASAALLASHLGFVVASGGDWMAAGRFLVGVVPCAAILCDEALTRVLPGLRRPVLVLLVALQLAAAVVHARWNSSSGPLWSDVPPAGVARADEHSWFELRNRSRIHDVRMIERLDEVLARIAPRKQGPLVVLSGQAGMVTYYTTRGRPGAVRFVDRFGLATREVTSCHLLDELPRSQVGVDLRYPYLMRVLPELESSCGFPRPDVVWDWDSADHVVSARIEEAGYTLVHRQDGFLFCSSLWLPGRASRANEFIAVRDELVRPDDPRTRYDYGN